MKKLVWLFLTLPLSMMARTSEGDCSITLLSDESTLGQAWCLETPVATIEPILWLVEGTGVQVDYLPAGVTAVLSNDTLTVSGTITEEGIHFAQITTNEGCTSVNMYMGMSVIVDPEFSCEVEGQDIILHWPGMNSLMEYGDEIFLDCSTPDGFFDLQVLFLPCPDSLVWSGLPVNAELTFTLHGNGLPYCFPGFYTSTCTIISTDVVDHEQDDLVVRAVQRGETLELIAPVSLSDVRIYDMLGGLVASQSVNAHTVKIRITSLASGAFLLRTVGADGRVSVQRFVKDR
jgi:hypothetical protein